FLSRKNHQKFRFMP
ncbi:glyoxalase/Bleomycin resistance /Dioxygenase superfamily protein, partial [Vibrio cholerae O1 str. 116059]